MKNFILITLVASMFPLASCAKNQVDNSTVTQFDLYSYLGTWYEIARYDHSFECGLTNVIAEYTLNEDGTVRVENSGWKNGKYDVAVGKAKYPDPDGNPGELKVSFFWFFYSPYLVMMVDDDYQISLVGSKSDDYLWILSRTPQADPDLLDMVLLEAELRGYDLSKLIWVDQSANI